MKGKAMPGLDSLQQMTMESYAKEPNDVGDWKLKKSTANTKFWVNGHEVIVGVQGTNSVDDVKAWPTIPLSTLNTTNLYKRNKQAIEEFQKEYSPSEYSYYAVGHSLGGAIIDSLLREGLLKEAVTYNPAIQYKDINGGLPNRRIYSSTDPLYKLMGWWDKRSEVRKPTEKSWVSFLGTFSLPTGILASLAGHSLGNFKGGISSSNNKMEYAGAGVKTDAFLLNATNLVRQYYGTDIQYVRSKGGVTYSIDRDLKKESGLMRPDLLKEMMDIVRKAYDDLVSINIDARIPKLMDPERTKVRKKLTADKKAITDKALLDLSNYIRKREFLKPLNSIAEAMAELKKGVLIPKYGRGMHGGAKKTNQFILDATAIVRAVLEPLGVNYVYIGFDKVKDKFVTKLTLRDNEGLIDTSRSGRVSHIQTLLSDTLDKLAVLKTEAKNYWTTKARKAELDVQKANLITTTLSELRTYVTRNLQHPERLDQEARNARAERAAQATRDADQAVRDADRIPFVTAREIRERATQVVNQAIGPRGATFRETFDDSFNLTEDQWNAINERIESEIVRLLRINNSVTLPHELAKLTTFARNLLPQPRAEGPGAFPAPDIPGRTVPITLPKPTGMWANLRAAQRADIEKEAKQNPIQDLHNVLKYTAGDFVARFGSPEPSNDLTAEWQIIKSNWKKWFLKFHPDKISAKAEEYGITDEEANNLFKEVTVAMNNLFDVPLTGSSLRRSKMKSPMTRIVYRGR